MRGSRASNTPWLGRAPYHRRPVACLAERATWRRQHCSDKACMLRIPIKHGSKLRGLDVIALAQSDIKIFEATPKPLAARATPPLPPQTSAKYCPFSLRLRPLVWATAMLLRRCFRAEDLGAAARNPSGGSGGAVAGDCSPLRGEPSARTSRRSSPQPTSLGP